MFDKWLDVERIEYLIVHHGENNMQGGKNMLWNIQMH